MGKSSISVIMPALNEEANLASSVEAVRTAFNDLCACEIIIVDDGSHDRTGQIADDLARQDPRIRVVHNPTNKGIGFCYKTGVEIAQHEYALMIPGDDETPCATIRAIGELAGRADLVITHTLNGHIRPLHRRVLSRTFTALMNLLFGLRLRYYNGNCLIRTGLLRTTPLETCGFSYMATVLIRLLKRGCTHVEIGISLQRREIGPSKALHPRSFADIFTSVLALALEVYTHPIQRSGDVEAKDAPQQEDPAAGGRPI